MTTEMIIYAAMSAGMDYQTAAYAPMTLVEDVIATHQIMAQGYERVLTDPDDIENDFQRTMSAR